MSIFNSVLPSRTTDGGRCCDVGMDTNKDEGEVDDVNDDDADDDNDGGVIDSNGDGGVDEKDEGGVVGCPDPGEGEDKVG